MRRCAKCQRPVTPRAEGRPFTTAYAEPDGTPISLLVTYECECGSHQSCVLWQCEDFAVAEHEEATAVEAYERDERPFELAAMHAPFSIALDLDALGI